MTADWEIVTRNKDEDEDQPYFHCRDCEENFYKGGHCKVADKYSGALGLCRKIGGPEC